MNDTIDNSNTQVELDTICQWLYNKGKYTKEGKPNTNRVKIGYIVAAKDADGVIGFGWSKCAIYDDFNPERAKRIAYGRLLAGTNTPLPHSFNPIMGEFVLRCKKYFQSDLTQIIGFTQY